MASRSRRRLALVALALFLGSGVLAIGYLLFGLGPHRIDWYRLDAPDLLTLEITTGSLSWARVSDVAETSDRVTITVKAFDLVLGPQTAAGYPRELTVRLARPLGSRLVYDGTGEEVPPYRAPEAAPPGSPPAGREPSPAATGQR